MKDQLHLSIADDGVGFDPDGHNDTDGLGLKNIESRVNYLNGTITLDSSDGTKYSIHIPIGDDDSDFY
ncbi:MAG: ATP-binding protein [Bacteroidota bacterium]